MSVAAVGTSLVYTGEGMTMYATAAGAPAVVLGHEAGNLLHFAMLAAAEGGYTVQQQDYVILGFVNGRLTVIGGESKAVIVIPTERGAPAPSGSSAGAQSTGTTQPSDDVQVRRQALEQALSRVEAQLAAARRVPHPDATAIAALQRKAEELRAALAQLASARALPGAQSELTGALVDVAA